MSIAAQKMFLDSLKGKLADSLTVTQMENVMKTVEDTVSRFELTAIIEEDIGNDVLLDAYFDAKSVEGLSERTLKQYRRTITRFLEFSKARTQNITQYHIRAWLNNEKERGIDNATLQGNMWALSSYFGWLHRDGLIPRNPIGNIGRIKVQKKVKETYSDVDIEKLKNGCHSLRDKAIISLFKCSGCRIGEIERLNRDDIDFVKGRFTVLGKGNKQRIAYMDPVTGMLLQEYLKTRTDDDPALFYSKKKQRMTQGGFRKVLTYLENETGVHHVHPHKFRRTEITELVKRGMPIEQVQVLAGHEKIDTTMKYVVIDDNMVENNYHKFA